MNILGVELEIDLFDADQLEVYERENEKVAKDIKEPTQYEGKSTADAIRIQCRIVDDFFDAVFGPGTAQKIFKGKANILNHMEAFGIVSQAARDARREFNMVEEKYAPNRAARRQEERDSRKVQKQNLRDWQQYAAVKGKGNNH